MDKGYGSYPFVCMDHRYGSGLVGPGYGSWPYILSRSHILHVAIVSIVCLALLNIDFIKVHPVYLFVTGAYCVCAPFPSLPLLQSIGRFMEPIICSAPVGSSKDLRISACVSPITPSSIHITGSLCVYIYCIFY